MARKRKPLNDPRHTATHEAGHAVIARVLTLACGEAVFARTTTPALPATRSKVIPWSAKAFGFINSNSASTVLSTERASWSSWPAPRRRPSLLGSCQANGCEG